MLPRRTKESRFRLAYFCYGHPCLRTGILKHYGVAPRPFSRPKVDEVAAMIASAFIRYHVATSHLDVSTAVALAELFLKTGDLPDWVVSNYAHSTGMVTEKDWRNAA